jgi:hypothetical protein
MSSSLSATSCVEWKSWKRPSRSCLHGTRELSASRGKWCLFPEHLLSDWIVCYRVDKKPAIGNPVVVWLQTAWILQQYYVLI